MDARASTVTTTTVLCLLVAGEIVLAFKTTEGPNPLSVALQYALIVISPLLVIAAAVLKGSKRTLALSCAWITIAVGAFIQYGFHSSHEPSKVLLLAISIVTYWLCGFVALFSFGTKRS